MIPYLAVLQIAYSSTLVYETPSNTDHGYAEATVLTDTDLVAGFDCEFTGHHGETDFARPFVWSKGKLTWLPMGKGSYGRVWGGDERTLYGEVMIKYREFPVAWTPDSKLGWSRPRLTRVGTLPGSAFGADSKGNVWVTDGHGTPSPLLRRFANGHHSDYPGLIYPVGIDRDGNIWGNRFDSSRTWPEFNIPVRFLKGAFNEVKVYARLAAVNLEGKAVGRIWKEDGSDYRVATFQDGQVTPIPLPPNQQCSVSDINDVGDVVGSYVLPHGEGVHTHPVAFIWKGGVLRSIEPPAQKLGYFEPTLINNHGSILASGTTGFKMRLYLMRLRR